MIPGGFYLMARGWLDHPALGGKREPFCRRAAWVWLIERAAYLDTRVSVAGSIVTLRRGQLSYSFRYLAEAWGWGLGATRCFLDRLADDGMITKTSDSRPSRDPSETSTPISTSGSTAQMVITICNYDRYQLAADAASTAPGTPSSTAAAQPQHSDSTNKNERNKGNEANEGKRARAARGSRIPSDWSPSAQLKAWAAAERPDVNVDLEVDQFRDHWIASDLPSAIKRDWDAGFRTWIRRARTSNGATHRSAGYQTGKANRPSQVERRSALADAAARRMDDDVSGA